MAVTDCEVLAYTVRVPVVRKLFCSGLVVIRLPLLPSDCFPILHLLLAFNITRSKAVGNFTQQNNLEICNSHLLAC